MQQMYAIRTDPRIDAVAVPENLRVGLMVAEQRKRCSAMGCQARFFNFAFGQSPFPVPPELVTSLKREAALGHYTEAAGTGELREAVAGFYARHFGIQTDPERVVVGNGSKELIYIIFSMMEATAVIPSPAWIGYAPIIRLLGKEYRTLPPRPERGYRLDPVDLKAVLAAHPAERHILIFNNPNNPTGALYTKQELEAIAEVCREYGCLVIADEIYALTTYDFDRFTSMGTVYPEGTFVTGGLSKDRSAAGYRLGTCILPEDCPEELIADFTKVAATMYTSVATPVQYAAITAYAEDPAVEEYMQAARGVHRIICRYMSKAVSTIDGVMATVPEGGFYFLADFNLLADDLRQYGVTRSNDLSTALLAHPHHVATIGGDAVMLPQDRFGIRVACVDYDGRRALDLYREERPATSLDETAFVHEVAPLMVEGVGAMRRFVEEVRKEAR
ncbi:pyridoxal phosphate-dependent aminotransferase [Methanofollis formosanus]|uniref:Aminotransferase n=1 Tax=Methanofollis formosanus TaxID=299308 RepID=A0A8G1A0J7_9EURY|nr:pyridoxal phosphate-dependent aminotransferase [Methanofollis formosanus]QYZ78325.1 pyridoxal phosphate-dependent aminotransferase [Methanofollis formosanus]